MNRESCSLQIRWVIPGILARSCRPCYYDEYPSMIKVQEWMKQVSELGIKSILCLLSENELKRYYAANEIDLLARYREQGFHVGHVPILDHQTPPLGSSDLKIIQQTLRRLPAPRLIHCSAGIDRTGATVEYIQNNSILSTQ